MERIWFKRFLKLYNNIIKYKNYILYGTLCLSLLANAGFFIWFKARSADHQEYIENIQNNYLKETARRDKVIKEYSDMVKSITAEFDQKLQDIEKEYSRDINNIKILSIKELAKIYADDYDLEIYEKVN